MHGREVCSGDARMRACDRRGEQRARTVAHTAGEQAARRDVDPGPHVEQLEALGEVVARRGLLDPSALSVPDTWLAPQLAGGIVFGTGLIVGGLCPGTSCVAASSGHLDGLALMAGMLAGTLGFEEAFPWLARLYDATPLGRFTLPDLLHLPTGAVVAVTTATAVGCFVLLWRHERRRRDA